MWGKRGPTANAEGHVSLTVCCEPLQLAGISKSISQSYLGLIGQNIHAPSNTIGLGGCRLEIYHPEVTGLLWSV